MNDQLKRKVEPLSDEEIVDLYWQRDENAIEETDVKYKKYLLSVACHFVSDRSDLEECLSDTYVGAWNAIPPARPKALQAFLTIIMRRTAINCYKINRRKKRIPAEVTDVYEDFADFIAAEQDVAADVESRELEAVINTCLLYTSIEGESLLLRLDMCGICASSGSACTSGSLDPSHVLLAIGVPADVAHGSLRISMGCENTKEDVDFLVEKLEGIVKTLRDMSLSLIHIFCSGSWLGKYRRCL